MFQRYTDSARRALFFARYAVSDLGGKELGTEHLLLGLMHEPRGLLARILTLAQVSADAIRADVEQRLAPGEQLAPSVEIPFSADARRALEFAAEEADRLLHGYVGTEHLLLGLLREDGSTAATVLKGRGLRLDDVRTAIVTMLGEGKGPSSSRTARSPDDEADVKDAEEAPIADRDAEGLFTDIGAIGGIRGRIESAENAGDAEAIAALLADDAVMMVPDYPVQEGKAACAGFIRDRLEESRAHFDRRIRYVSGEIAVRGDLAFDRGTFAFEIAPSSGGEKRVVTGKYLWLLARDDGGWKLARIVVSRDDAPEEES